MPSVAKFSVRGAQRISRLPKLLRPRRFRVFGVGIERTGTTTLAALFRRYKAGHEFDRAHAVPLATAAMNGTLGVEEARHALRHRDRRFRLEVDCAPFLVPFAPMLAELHGDAKFVLTLRDCFSWLASDLDWEAAFLRHGQPFWPEFCESMFGGYREPFDAREQTLVEAGIRWSIAARLRFWADANQHTLDTLPSDRLLVVRTEELSSCASRLADFVGVPPERLTPAHMNSNPSRAWVLRRVAPDFVAEVAQKYCDPLMRRFWGDDWMSLQHADPTAVPSGSRSESCNTGPSAYRPKDLPMRHIRAGHESTAANSRRATG